MNLTLRITIEDGLVSGVVYRGVGMHDVYCGSEGEGHLHPCRTM